MKKGFLVFLLLHVISSITVAQEAEPFKTDDGETLYYTKSGHGSKVVLLCGGPGFGASLMKPWLDSLSHQFEPVLFEQRGTGLSSNVKLDNSTINISRACQDIDNLREHLGEARLNLCGYSWGCMLALAYAARYPTKVNHVILLSPGPGGVDLTTVNAVGDNVKWNTYPAECDSIAFWRERKNQVSNPARAARLRMVFSFMNRFYDHDLGRKALEKYLQDAEYNPVMAELMWQDMNKGFDLRSSIKKYKGRCHIIRPRQEVMPGEILLRIKEALPQTQIVYLEKCGHLADLEKPKELFSLIRSLLSEKSE